MKVIGKNTGKQMREVLLLISEHSDTHETEAGKEICVYHDGWSDTQIAKQLGHNNVGKIRTTRGRYFGHLPQDDYKNEALNKRMEQVEDNVELWRQQLIVDKADQEARLQEVEKLLNFLEKTQTKHRAEQLIAERMLEKLRPLIDEPKQTTPIKTNGQAKELN
jgi:hypothetical protein